jgi:hypothetical protein
MKRKAKAIFFSALQQSLRTSFFEEEDNVTVLVLSHACLLNQD